MDFLVEALTATATAFLDLLVKVLPFFFIGAATGAAIEAFVPKRWARRLFAGSPSASLSSAITAGALLPGCSCTTMAMAEGVRGTGTAVLAALVPEHAIPSLLGGSSGARAYALAAVVGIPLYVCEGEEDFLRVGEARCMGLTPAQYVGLAAILFLAINPIRRQKPAPTPGRFTTLA